MAYRESSISNVGMYLNLIPGIAETPQANIDSGDSSLSSRSLRSATFVRDMPSCFTCREGWPVKAGGGYLQKACIHPTVPINGMSR